MNFNATIKEGKLSIDTPEKWKQYLSGCSADTPGVLTVEKKKGRRSLSQNGYYWVYLGVIENETGNNADDLHELFKRKFLTPVEKTVLGEKVRFPASTTELGKTEFSEYMDKICALTNVPLPDPELAGYISNYGI